MYLKLPVPCVDRSVVYTKRGNRSGLPWGCEHFITNITQNYEYIVIIKSRLTFSPFAAFYLIPCRQYTTYCLHPGKLIPTEPLSLTSSPHPTGREAIAVHSVLCLIFLIHGCGKETLPGAGSHPIVHAWGLHSSRLYPLCLSRPIPSHCPTLEAAPSLQPGRLC